MNPNKLWADTNKYSSKTNFNESSRIVEKLINAAEKGKLEDETNIELIMKCVWQVDEAESIIKNKDGLFNQLEKKVQGIEEKKHWSESTVAKKCKI